MNRFRSGNRSRAASLRRAVYLLAALLVCVEANAESGMSDVSHLPMGSPVPVGQSISSAPRPYDPALDDPPFSASDEERAITNVATNIAAVIPFLSADRGTTASSSTAIPGEFPGSGDRGYWVKKGQGIFSGNDAQRNILIPSSAIGTTIYAPTHMSAGGACIETVTAHWRYSGMDSTAHAHGFWDHCTQGTWQVFEFMDSTWVDTYIRKLDNEEMYFTQVYQGTDGCWSGFLFNFLLGSWEVKTTPVCDSSDWQDGWTMWESRYMMDEAKVCPVFPNVRSRGIQWYGGTPLQWRDLTSSDVSQLGPYGLCWDNGKYYLTDTLNHWQADTDDVPPPPNGGGIEP